MVVGGLVGRGLGVGARVLLSRVVGATVVFFELVFLIPNSVAAVRILARLWRWFGARMAIVVLQNDVLEVVKAL